VHVYKINEENCIPYEAIVFELGVYKHFVRAIMNQWTVPLEWNIGMEYWNVILEWNTGMA